MNKKQKKERLKYLKQLQKGPDPKEAHKRYMLSLLLPDKSEFGKCSECVFQIKKAQKPRSSVQKHICICPSKTSYEQKYGCTYTRYGVHMCCKTFKRLPE